MRDRSLQRHKKSKVLYMYHIYIYVRTQYLIFYVYEQGGERKKERETRPVSRTRRPEGRVPHY